MGIQHADEFAAQRRVVAVDHRHGDVPQHFRQIGQRVKKRIDDDGAEKNQRHTRVRKNGPVFVHPDFPYILHRRPRKRASGMIVFRRRRTGAADMKMKSANNPIDGQETAGGAPRTV